MKIKSSAPHRGISATSNVVYPHVFSPFTIRGLTLRNCVVFPPIATNFAGEGGEVTPYIKRYYERRAEGGTGLVIVENANVDPPGRNGERQLRIDDERSDGGAGSGGPVGRPREVRRGDAEAFVQGRDMRYRREIRQGRRARSLRRFRCGGSPWRALLPHQLVPLADNE